MSRSFQLLALLVLLALFACSSLAEINLRRSAVNCVRTSSCASKDWKVARAADDSDILRVLIAVNEKNQDVLQRILNEVSDINSPKYGRHLSFEQIGVLMKNQEAIDAIEGYLQAHGVDMFKTTPNGEFIVAYMTVAQASEILSTKFYRFQSAVSKQTIVRAFEYTIPEALKEHVVLFGNVISFPITKGPQPLISSFPSPAKANGSVTPALISSFYDIQNNKVSSQKVTQSLFESGQSYSPTDLSSFQSTFNVAQNPITKVVGTNKPNICTINPNGCAEANLDVQYIMAVAQDAPTWFWVQGGTGDVFLEWIMAVGSTSDAPLVHSISYGSLEPEENADELKEFDQEAAKLGAQGITIVVSSGDDGVANFEARSNKGACGFTPSFPATATNIVAVGATQGPESGKPEVMCSSKTGGVVTSGGGFSTVFDQPSFQSSAVQGYMNSGVTLPPSSQYNGGGRGYPDVALLGYNYEVYIGGQIYGVSGTSCSAPTFAGMLSLVNDARISAGKSSLGLVTPALYSIGGSNNNVFNDVTQGENNCCAGTTNPVCCQYGFYAAAGWDPTTGFGSVNVQNLISALLKV